MLICIYFLLTFLDTCNGDVWTRGVSAPLTVDLTANANYSLTVNSASGQSVWLTGAGASVHCKQTWSRFSDGTLKWVQSRTFSGTDSGTGKGSLGSYDAVSIEWRTQDGSNFTTVFQWFSTSDVFAFQQIFSDGCASGASFPQPDVSGREFNASTLPLSEFPIFHVDGTALQSKLGYITWAGRFCADDSNYGVGLSGFSGGSEGGPLVLFLPNTAQSSALVLSPLDNFMNGILAKRSIRSSSGDCIVENNIDYEGNDLYFVENVTSADQCCKDCEAEPKCNCWSWMTPSDPAPYTNRCYLKTSTSGRTSSSHISGMNAISDLVFGIQGQIDSIPVGFTTSFILSPLTNQGINAAVQSWGKLLQQRYGTTRLAKDILVQKLGYWTDNGGYYYGGNPLTQSVGIDLFNSLNDQGIPIAYLQLDPFWYPDGPDNGCCIDWNPNPDFYPQGLQYLSNQTGKPLLLYASYFCPTQTPSHYPGFTFSTSNSFDVGWAKGQIAIVDATQAYSFYNQTMNTYIQQGVLVAFEVDFLDFQYLLFPDLTTSLTRPQSWSKGMADAAFQYGLPIQYCMGLSNYMLQALSYPAVTNARATEDNFPTSTNRWQIAYTALFYSAVALKPFMDVIWTTGHQPGNPYGVDRYNVELEAVISITSAGPVGIGDGKGYTNKDLVMQLCTLDGSLLSPSVPATPIDATYSSGGSYKPHGEVWQTHTSIGQSLWWYILAVDVDVTYNLVPRDIWPTPNTDSSITGFLWWKVGNSACTGNSPVNNCVKKIDANTPLPILTGGQQGNVHAWNLLSVTPVFKSGWSLLGEPNKFVTVSPVRFQSVTDTGTGLSVVITGVPKEVVALLFVNPSSSSLYSVNATISASGTITINVP